MFGKINQRGITLKVRNGKQSFLRATGHSDLIYIPIKLHEDIPNSYRVMACIRIAYRWTDRWMDSAMS